MFARERKNRAKLKAQNQVSRRSSGGLEPSKMVSKISKEKFQRKVGAGLPMMQKEPAILRYELKASKRVLRPSEASLWHLLVTPPFHDVLLKVMIRLDFLRVRKIG